MVLDIVAKRFDLVFQRFSVAEQLFKQQFQSEPQIVEQVAVKNAGFVFLQGAVVSSERRFVPVKPVPGFLDERLVDIRCRGRAGKLRVAHRQP